MQGKLSNRDYGLGAIAIRTVIVFAILAPPLYALFYYVRSVEWGDELPLIVELFVGGPETISHLRELSLIQLFVYVLNDIASTVIPVYITFILVGLWKAWRMRK